MNGEQQLRMQGPAHGQINMIKEEDGDIWARRRRTRPGDSCNAAGLRRACSMHLLAGARVGWQLQTRLIMGSGGLSVEACSRQQANKDVGRIDDGGIARSIRANFALRLYLAQARRVASRAPGDTAACSGDDIVVHVEPVAASRSGPRASRRCGGQPTGSGRTVWSMSRNLHQQGWD